jgi:foldase protein PrsA
MKSNIFTVRHLTTIAALCLIFSLSFGCKKKEDEDYAIKINETTVSKVEFNRLLEWELAIMEQIAKVSGKSFDPDSAIGKKYRDGLRQKLINKIVDKELLLQEARAANIASEPEVAKKQLADMARRLGGEEKLQEVFTSQGISQEKAEQELLGQIMVQRLRDKKISEIGLDETEAKTLYDASPGQFNTPEKIDLSHILLASKEEALNMRGRLIAGEELANLTIQYSLDPTAKLNRGDIGTFEHGKLEKKFEDFVFNLQVGQYSEPFETEHGWHILIVRQKHPVVTLSWEENKHKIVDQLLRDKQERFLAQYIADLKNAAQIDIRVGASAMPVPSSGAAN